METSRTQPDGIGDLPPLHPAFTLVSVLVLGLAGLALPGWLASANPSGLEMVDGVVVHAADAPGATLRGEGFVGSMLARNSVEPGSDATAQFAVGLYFVCLDEDSWAELTAVRAVPRRGTPEIPTSGIVRRFALGTAEPGDERTAVGFFFGDPVKERGDVGTWHDLTGVEVTGACPEEPDDFDPFEAGGEEVVALLEVGEEGIDVDFFEVEATVDGRPHRLVVDADVTVCGTQVRGVHHDPSMTCDD